MSSSSPQSHYDDYNHHCSKNIRYTREQKQQRAHQKQLRSLSYNDGMMERSASVHKYTKKVNNLSAMYIEIGKYDKAIDSLGKVLKLSEEIHATMSSSEACDCRDCSLDACIHHSESDSNLMEFVDISKSIKKKKNKNLSWKNNNEDLMDIINAEPTLYQRPIRIPKRPICEGHNMGSTVFRIIAFNLALAHHLKALKKIDSTSFNKTSSLLNSTVKLYKLANNWQHSQCDYLAGDDFEEEDDEDDMIVSMEEMNTYSARFNIILFNNMNHLNQLIINNDDVLRTRSSSSTQLLDDLLSSVLSHADTTNENEAESCSTDFVEEDYCQQTQQSLSCVSDEVDLEFEYYDTNEENGYLLHNPQQEELVRHHCCYSSKLSSKPNLWLDDVMVERSRYNSTMKTSSLSSFIQCAA